MIFGLIGCWWWKEPPETPTCTDERVFFTPASMETHAREFDDGYHNDGPFVAILDLDRDGYMDILQCFPREEIYLHSWQGRRELFDTCGFMLVVDLNQDGWDDLIMASEDEALDINTVVILENQEGRFEERSSFMVGEDVIRTIRGGDFNGDGHMDLFLSKNGFRDDQSDRDVVAYGLSTWEFEVEEESLEEEYAARKAFDSIVMDIDQNGKPDIYVANDRGYEFGGNVLWTSSENGWVLEEDCGCVPTQDAMGVDIADYNHDGILDIVTSDVQRTYLFEGLGNGEFVDMTQVRGANLMEEKEMSWGLRFVDIENDGETEIFSAQGDHTYEGLDNPEYIGDLGLSIQTIQEGQFVEIQDELGFAMQGSFRSVIPFHWNGDGVLDYWITDVEQSSILMESNGCSDGAWLFVTGPMGTALRFQVAEKQYYGEVHGSSSYNASISPQLHFGLGNVEVIRNVEVRYPNSEWQLIHEELSVPHQLALPFE